MAKKIPYVDLLTETFDTWLNRTNSVIDILGSEAITANTSLGVTGTPAVQLNSRLFGTFTANNLTAVTTLSVPGAFTATPTSVAINAPISINGSVGANGQILTSNGSALSWTTLRIDTAANSGLIGGPITSSGELRVKVGNGIKVDNSGINLDVPFVQSQITNVSTLQGYTWEAPGAIGLSSANTGTFTTTTSNTYRITNVSTDNFLLSSSLFRIAGFIDATTPGNGITDTNGAVKIRSRGTGRGVIQFTNQAATTEFGNLSVGDDGILRWSGNLLVNASNATGAGLILSDDGDIVDMNDGYASFRFSSGIAVYSANKGGTPVARIKNDGTIESNGNRVVTINDFTTGLGNSSQQWLKLPNGAILQWGSLRAPSIGSSSIISLLPTSYTVGYQVFISPLSDYDDNDDGNEVFFAQQTSLSYFTFYNATPSDNNTTDFSWFTIGY